MTRASVPMALVVAWACGETVEVPLPSLERMESQVAEKIEATRDRVQNDPGSGEAWGKLGMVFEAHGLLDDARVCYQRAAELESDDYRWTYYLAALEKNRDPAAALELAALAEKLSPRSVAVLYLKASILEQLDTLDEARRAYERILDVEPNVAIAEFALGRLDLVAGNLDGAEAHLERAAELQPTAGAVQAALAQLYRRRGERERATVASARARELLPEIVFPDPLIRAIRDEEVSTRALQRRAQQAEASGEVAVAERLHLRLLELHPDEAELHYNAGNFFGRRGRTEEAERRYRRALELDANSTEAMVNLGNLLAARGELDEAVRLMRRALELEPASITAKVGLSSALAQRGELGEAARLLDAVLLEEPDLLPALQGLAQIRTAEGRVDDASALFARALAAHPDDGRTHFLVAIHEARRGGYERAWRHLREAERLHFAVPEDFVDALRSSSPEPVKAPNSRE